MSGEKESSGTVRRVLGGAYILIIVCGIWAEGVVRGNLLVPGEAAATAAAVREHEASFRASLLADAMMVLCDIVVGVLFYTLLRLAHPVLAHLALVLRLVQAALIGASLVLLSGTPLAAQRGQDDLALLLTELHATGYDVGLIPFGINCLIMGLLLHPKQSVAATPSLLRAPRPIAWGLAASGLVYLLGSICRLVAPDARGLVEPFYAIPFFSETALALWLFFAST
ncbi:uncharacterized protein MONBRDRAFT_33953 [Monosiga brevicollis MX1]|uniref:DUF4386 domain-containing protein n=1 Tax=Monosiga brevicollis TaxID=81824 RepID=A9V8Q8_MONBE|nr:uncharacterized protein MONBRDRAFT_33953 [Monosiga brevicollis MX1]EDQ86186.1 predicted protein [Monosiga brevicollis MX1]|eukprot:XP_001749111.1 hypothetical protein [Monosiga brevicollis MX1]